MLAVRANAGDAAAWSPLEGMPCATDLTVRVTFENASAPANACRRLRSRQQQASSRCGTRPHRARNQDVRQRFSGARVVARAEVRYPPQPAKRPSRRRSEARNQNRRAWPMLKIPSSPAGFPQGRDWLGWLDLLLLKGSRMEFSRSTFTCQRSSSDVFPRRCRSVASERRRCGRRRRTNWRSVRG